MNSKKVIVTGGAGFIGSHLVEELVRRDYQVIILDDLSTGREDNIGQLLKRDNVRLVQGTVTDLHLLQGLFKNADYIFHQAAIASVSRSIENPHESHCVNITGTLNVLLAARDGGVRKVIFASSSAVYGDTPTLPQIEDMIPDPQSPYALTKLVGEYYCSIFHRIYALPTICLRYFNVYGPRQTADSQYAAVVPMFIARVLQDKPPTIYGDGKQTRDFTFIRDVIEANILAAESDADGIFNIGTGKSITINEMTELIINLLGSDIKPIHQEPRSGDVKHSLADITRAQSFGYTPRHNLEEGLKEVISRFRDKT